MMRVLLTVCLPLAAVGVLQAAPERPSVLVILADDLGYSDLGCYGSAIRTPHLDGLAREGLRFSQFYNTARCWPTRAALLTGYYAQQVRRDRLPGAGGGGGSRNARPDWAVLLPTMLRASGYRSYHSGKWHVDGLPLQNGFDRSLVIRDHNRFFSPQKLLQDDRPLPPVKPGSDYYVTDAVADHAIACLKEHQQRFPDRPFFHFVAFTAPHFPLQAPADDVARYRDTLLRDWEAVRRERWQRQQAMGLLTCGLSAVERDLGPPYDFPNDLKLLGPGEVNRPRPWGDLTEQQRRFQADKMAVHAAMIDRMDQQIGRILQQLRQMQAEHNTLVLFLSDNGASAEIMVRGDGHDPQAEPGSAASFLCLGPGWSTAANTPFRRHKTWVHEGGISTPLIARWPAGISDRGAIRHAVGHVIDIVPTVLELAGLSWSEAGHPDAPVPPGRSLVPAFGADERAPADRTLWWLHDGHRALRTGRWKLVAAKGEPWELYDLSTDRIEQNNLASAHPERVRNMEQIWSAMTESFREFLNRP